ncbi:MAG: hypothetical protein HUK02_10555, partial [Bacteroidaceae bacterium]|nr:hypothetical protein [Bacteroidaceae bacterium]
MRRILSTLLSILFSAALYANTSTKVECVTELVTLTTPIDYIITSDSETDAITGTLAIANDCVAVIFENLKPTVTSKTAFLANVTINGRKAVDGTNCHVAVYRHGSILFPYCKTPLTVYNEAGESKSAWTVGSAYRVLSKWDNCITRFTLKRGYMVTMANHSDGTGYSHVFVAQDEDLDVTLPAAMQQSVSFLRVFEWNYPGKKGLAEDNTKAAGLMNMGWFYNWAASNYQYQNFDYVPERHHESGWTKNGEYKGAWPSWDEINSNVATHVLGMNEPDNGSVEVYMTPEDMFKHHKDYLKSGNKIEHQLTNQAISQYR